jgi:hypothetical protein
MAARSGALFTEAGKVLNSPCCMNCHPAGDRPLQGEAGRLHQPPVERGADGFGMVTMRCSATPEAYGERPAGRLGLEAGIWPRADPGTQEQLGALIGAWLKTGAACPP